MQSQEHRQRTDEELDRDWTPSGRRPQSTVARSFSLELMDIFRIENSLTDLDQKVEQKRQVVGEGNRELASLEARLKKMEDRLRKTQGGNPSGHSTISLPHRPPTRDAKGMPAPQDGKIRSRPGTASANQAAPGSGNMPPTPSASEDGDHE